MWHSVFSRLAQNIFSEKNRYPKSPVQCPFYWTLNLFIKKCSVSSCYCWSLGFSNSLSGVQCRGEGPGGRGGGVWVKDFQHKTGFYRILRVHIRFTQFFFCFFIECICDDFVSSMMRCLISFWIHCCENFWLHKY